MRLLTLNSREGTSNRGYLQSPSKKNIPPNKTFSLPKGDNLEELTMDNFCRDDKSNHYEMNFLSFNNMFKVFFFGDETRNIQGGDDAQGRKDDAPDSFVNNFWGISHHLFDEKVDNEIEGLHVAQQTFNIISKGDPSGEGPSPTTFPLKNNLMNYKSTPSRNKQPFSQVLE